MMLDTTDNILRKQREIIYKKTISERFLLGAEMIDFGRFIVENSIREKNENITENDLKIEVFKRYYSAIFDRQDMKKIIKSLNNVSSHSGFFDINKST